MLKKTLLAAVVVGVMATGVQAAEPVSGYIFGSLGQSDADISDASDTEDTAWKAGLGLQLNQYVGIEAQYTDLGAVEGDVIAGGAVFNATAETEGFGGNLVGTLPLERLKLFAKLGYHKMETEARVSGFGLSASDDASEWVTSYGIGAAFALTPRFDIVAEYEQYSDVADEYDVEMLSAGLRFSF